MTSGRTIIVAAADQVSCDLAGDTAILHLKSGTYYSLNRLGSYIWNIIQEPTPVDDIRRRLLDEYDVESSHCEKDLLALIDDLAAAGLIEVHGESRT
jgi:hypothetical protein